MKYFKKTVFLYVVFSWAFSAQAQTNESAPSTRKGQFFFHWGYNRANFTQSDLTLKGEGYNFTIQNIKAVDRPSDFSFKEYFSPVSFTIPQYNGSFGYYLTEKLSLSFNVDHMKYVMIENQVVRMDGYIDEPNNPFNGQYTQQDMKLTEDFLTFEHTDGLNYLNFEAEYTQNLFRNRKGTIAIEALGAGGLGVMLPKSNVKLFSYPRNDHFHIAGFGISSRIGMRFVFFKHFFTQWSVKGGFINMPDIVTRGGGIKDRAKQHFFFLQESGSLGVFFRFKR